MINTFLNAFNGIKYTLQSQKNMKIHCICASIAIFLGFYFKISSVDWTLLILSIFFVLVTETINTAIETTINLITKKKNTYAMLSKDIAAGAVLLSACNACIIGYIIFFKHINTIFTGG